MTTKLKILVIASEIAPFAKVGGLADVIGSLPCALKRLGCDVSIALPAYRVFLENKNQLKFVTHSDPVAMGDRTLDSEIYLTELSKEVPLYLIRRDEFFDRTGIYGDSRGEYFDNIERYVFFSKCIPALCKAIDLKPDIILANDWQTGLVMPFLKNGALPGTAGVFIVHNMGYHGLVKSNQNPLIGLPDNFNTIEGMEYFGQMSLLKAGIVYSNAVVTVSPSYAKEIQSSELGCGLDGLMRHIRHRLYGVLNGVDYEIWNPQTDHNISMQFNKNNFIKGKAACKKELMKIFGLAPQLVNRPLIGMVSRLVSQKGFDLLMKTAERILSLDVGIIILGDGDLYYQDFFQRLHEKYPDRFGLKLGYHEFLPGKIIAGADMFLIPSLYEPCGLTQIYSLKYGTVPIVRATGGLKDTVVDASYDNSEAGTGFKFHEFDPEEMLKAVKRAIASYENKKIWKKMIIEAMKQDFSWNKSAEEYIKIFRNII